MHRGGLNTAEYLHTTVGAIHVFVGPARIHGVVREVPMVAHAVYDYRTAATNLSPEKLVNAPTFHEVQREVAAIIRDKILVGHRLWTFLSIMGLSHPAIKTRDLALFIPLRRKLKARKVVELNVLVEVYMGRNLEMMYEDSLEHARAAMDMFRSCEGLFESVIAEGSWPCNLPPTTYAQYYT
ncbi:hypothetical protein VNI00_001931 [Paramarasmius palmivorus]|uniref:Exonuclease domain-containing protein n=1 Tax=Paramarasmius palmivorus TaxID=297713 RepID=A0AAW0E3Z7_9AGAR